MQSNIILLLILTALLWGVTPIIEKRALQGAEPFIGLIFRNMTVTFILVIAVLATGKIKEVLNTSPRTMLLFAFTGVTAGLLAMLTYFAALKLGATSKVVPVTATYPLVTVILGVLILGEQVTLMRVIGTILIIAGIWLVHPT
ncbi:MAG: EamA family transporter [Planctomycetes bacterium]|nr:EamA family transporter [Planctomycetota bacterium]